MSKVLLPVKLAADNQYFRCDGCGWSGKQLTWFSVEPTNGENSGDYTGCPDCCTDEYIREVSQEQVAEEASRIHSLIIGNLYKQGCLTKDSKLLKEAYRRYMMFAHGKPLKVAWVGLGYPSQYKSEYFRPLGRIVPRANNWWLLSEKGVEVMERLVSECPIPTDPIIVNKLNENLFL